MAKIKDKDKVLKAAREKRKVTYKGKPIRLSSDYSTETLQARREWHDIFNAMKQKALNQEYYIQHDYHLNMKEGLNNSRQAKVEGICLPQTTSTGYFKGTALDGSTPKAKQMLTEKIKSHQRNQTNQILTKGKK